MNSKRREKSAKSLHQLKQGQTEKNIKMMVNKCENKEQ